MKKILIIGGVAGGATVAARLRRMDENVSIIMFEKGSYISYANCGLPYYIGGVITERNNLFVQTPQGFGRRFNLDIRVNQEVIAVNPVEQTVDVKNLKTGESYTESYDKLVLSPGAEPMRPPIPGIDLDGIFTLRNVPDTDRIKEYIEKNQPKRAVVVGAGFIGLEMAENLHHLGINVSIVEMAEQVMTPLDYSMATLVHQHLKTKNVEFYLKEAVMSFADNAGKIDVKLQSGRVIGADMVILSIGVRPDTKLAKAAGLTVGKAGGIVINEFMQTSDPFIYALGDAIEFPHPILKKSLSTYLAGPANKQGRIVADNLVFGNSEKYTGSIGTAIAKVFDLTVAATGVSDKLLQSNYIDYASSIVHVSSHAGYYPGSTPMTIKINFDKTSGKLYGAQIVGHDGVDKRIDLFSQVIKSGGTIHDLTDIEHAYAPPFSSAKDPVNIAGFVAENIINGKVNAIQVEELLKLNSDEITLIDVRTPEEFDLGTINGAINIGVDDIREKLASIPKDRKVIVFCGVGLRAYIAARILSQAGCCEVYNLSGGYKTYIHYVQKQSNEDIFEHDFIGKDDIIYQADPEHLTRT